MAFGKLGDVLSGKWNTWNAYERRLNKLAPNVSQWVNRDFPLELIGTILQDKGFEKDRYTRAIHFLEGKHAKSRTAISSEVAAEISDTIDKQVLTSIAPYLGGFEFIRTLPHIPFPTPHLDKARAIAEAEPYAKIIAEILDGIGSYLSLFPTINEDERRRLADIRQKIEKRDPDGVRAVMNILIKVRDSEEFRDVRRSPTPFGNIGGAIEAALRYLAHLENTFRVVVPFPRKPGTN